MYDENIKTSYAKFVKTGLRRAKSSTCVICGTARNIGANVHNISQQIESLGNKFNDYRVLVFENDSTDDTRVRLAMWAGNNLKVDLDCRNIGNPKMIDLSLRRIQYMSEYRNVLIDKVESIFYHYDYMIMVDLDLIGFDINGIMNTIGHEDWDAVASNGRIRKSISEHEDVFYDIFGHRELDEYYQRVGNLTQIFGRLQDKYRSLCPGDDFVTIGSSFNGLAVYKVESIIGSRYNALPGYAEHVGFHYDMSVNGFDRIFINPSQLTYYDQHSKQKWERELNEYFNVGR